MIRRDRGGACKTDWGWGFEMKKLVFALGAVTAMTGAVSAADLTARPYVKAPAPIAAPSWTGFYVFGGGGGGLWNADSELYSTGSGFFGPIAGPAGTPRDRDRRLGGSGWFGTVGAGYDWQFSNWVAGVFADGQFGDIRGSLNDTFWGNNGSEKLRTSYAAGARLGYLVAPNVLSYVNAGYTGSEWSGTTQIGLQPGSAAFDTTPSFHRDGWFVGGGVENNLSIFGITAPGWFMKSEYRSAYYDRVALPETLTPAFGTGLTGIGMTFKPWVQTVSTSLVYRFNDKGVAAVDVAPRIYSKAPSAVGGPNWTGFYAFGGGGGGLWAADSTVLSTVPGFFGAGPAGSLIEGNSRFGGSGWFATVGAGYDWQVAGKWVAGLFGDGQFGDIRGSLIDTFWGTEGTEKLRTSYAAGARLGYLVAPNVLSYVNAGYSGSEWSGANLSILGVVVGNTSYSTNPSFRRDGWFVGGGVENSLSLFGLATPGWFMKTEYRAAYYDRITLPQTCTAEGAASIFGCGTGAGTSTGTAVTFKPWVQTISTSIVYRFNSDGAVVAKY
ncbi:outer membrane protein [Bradyrhizobium manausense]|uniref:outer membrane protein n=2 Tax=Bradyrhizobium TaxID=374 RepID=UPI002011D6AC|nr:autotransporter domain-containing protein [Bradyrhizobium manausense]